MRTIPTRLAVLAAFFVIVPAGLIPVGCLSPRPPIEVRYFDPANPVSTDRPAPSASDVSDALALQKGRATASASLGERIVWRLSNVELAFDERNRWADPPATLLDRALNERLFGAGAFAATGDPDSAELFVHLEAFEGRLDATPAEARIVIEARVRHRGGLETVRRFLVSEPLRSDAAAPWGRPSRARPTASPSSRTRRSVRSPERLGGPERRSAREGPLANDR